MVDSPIELLLDEVFMPTLLSLLVKLSNSKVRPAACDTRCALVHAGSDAL
jgi:hypothetical protein